MQRWETVERFRARLSEVIARTQLSQSAFAKAVGIDRSTLSQILSKKNDRLPRVETLAAIATATHVSVDWLIGLTEEGAHGTDILEVERGARSPADERLTRWRAEAAGYKIRYVPSTLPDLLRTDAVIDYEYRSSPIASPEQRQATREERLDYERRAETDTEVSSPRQSLEAFADGSGVWSGLDADARRSQLARMADLSEELYPTFRWFLFDGLARTSVPLTIFGPKRAVLYTGQMYLVFATTRYVRLFTEHFDELIRHAVIQPPDVPTFLRGLLDRVAD
jgi:transcriptional regulator with XRE-family HTH domain